MSVCVCLSLSGFLNFTPLTVTDSSATGLNMFTLTLDKEILELENYEEKLSLSPLRQLSFTVNLIDFGVTEVNLQSF